MAHYKANSKNSKNVTLTLDDQKLGELIYQKWYSFNAEIELVDGEKYQIEPKGFWDAKIASYSVSAWFILSEAEVSVQTFAVPLTSLHTSRINQLATC